MSNRTCNSCGWVCFGFSREFAERSVIKFNEYFSTLTKQEQDDYYGGRASSMEDYEKCFKCGGPYTNFRESQPEDCPDGCTIQPILHE